MRAVIDRVLELEKKENEAAWVDPSRWGQVNLAVPIQECFEIVKPLAREKNLKLSFELPESFLVWGDAERLRQVFLNLISNAVKYNKRDGKVIVRGSLLADARVRIDVEDTGIGLSEVERKKLFQKYYRTQDADRTSVTGSGLGLYLSRRWIESLGGTISVESESGKGSCFRVELPVRRESGRSSDV
jgi:signal transduction histidine kinase